MDMPSGTIGETVDRNGSHMGWIVKDDVAFVRIKLSWFDGSLLITLPPDFAEPDTEVAVFRIRKEK